MSASSLRGLLISLREETVRYESLLEQLLELETRLELSKEAIARIRLAWGFDLLGDAFTGGMVTSEPIREEWKQVFARVEYVGRRVGDAAEDVVKANGEPLSSEAVVAKLRAGGFRFRSPNPVLEVHAALNRKPHVKRVNDMWTYVGKPSGDDAAQRGSNAA